MEKLAGFLSSERPQIKPIKFLRPSKLLPLFLCSRLYRSTLHHLCDRLCPFSLRYTISIRPRFHLESSMRVCLVPKAPGSAPIPLRLDGNTIIGRGPAFGITDRRVSRKHGEIVVSSTSRSVTIRPVSPNQFNLTILVYPYTRIPHTDTRLDA